MERNPSQWTRTLWGLALAAALCAGGDVSAGEANPIPPAQWFEVSLNYDHAFAVGGTDSHVPQYWQGYTFAGQLRLLRLGVVGAKVGLFVPLVHGEPSAQGASGVAVSDLNVWGGVDVPRLRWGRVEAVPRVRLTLVAPTSSWSRRSGMVLGIAPRVELVMSVRMGQTPDTRLLFRLGYAAYRYLHEYRSRSWLGEVNAFGDMDTDVGPSILHGYLQNVFVTRWHMDAQLEAELQIFRGLGVAAAFHVFVDEGYVPAPDDAGGTLFGKGFTSPLPTGVEAASYFGSIGWDWTPYAVGEVRYRAFPWLTAAAGASYRGSRFSRKARSSLTLDPNALMYRPLGVPETRVYLVLRFVATSRLFGL